MRELTFQAAPAKLQVLASAPNKLPTFSMIGYSGGPMRLEGHEVPIVVDLGSVELAHPNSTPILYEHDKERILGHAVAEVTASGIVLTGSFSGAGVDRDRVVQAGKNGYPWQASIGGRAAAYEVVPDGEQVEVNGRVFTGPLKVARGVVVREVSVVSLGADPQTSTSVAASLKLRGSAVEGFEDWVRSLGFDPAELSQEQRDRLSDEWASKRSAAEASDDLEDDDESKETQASYRRVPYRRSQLKQTSIDKMVRTNPEIVATGLKMGWSADKMELEILRANRPTAMPFAPGSGGPSQGDVLAASLALACGFGEKSVGRTTDQRTMNEAVSAKHRNASLHNLMATIAHAAGKPLQAGQRFSDSTLQQVFEADRSLQAAGDGYSTVSLSGILSNVMGKGLLSSFIAVDSVVDKICGVANVADFKAWTRYRLTGGGEMEQVGPAGDLKHMTLMEETITGTPLATYGRMLTLTRQMLINDDLQALSQIPQIQGRQCAIGREKGVFSLLLSNPGNFFHANNGNYLTGTDSVLSLTSLGKAQTAFRQMVDENGDPILLAPKSLLVPPPLEVESDSLVRQTTLVAAGLGDSPDLRPNGNPFAGKYDRLVSPFLSNTKLTGNSNTGWYLFADPADVPAMLIAYLNGNTVPVIESAQTSFETLGMQFRTYFDFSVSMADKRGAVFSKGAA